MSGTRSPTTGRRSRVCKRTGEGSVTTDHFAACGPGTTTRSGPSSRTPWNSTTSCSGAQDEKIVLNMGVGDAVGQAKLLEGALSDMETIVMTEPVITQARRASPASKLREVRPSAARSPPGDRMCKFSMYLSRLAIPRIRDFGLPPKSLERQQQLHVRRDQAALVHGSTTTGRHHGMDITIVTTAKTNEGKALLDAFSFPFRREGSDP